MGVLRWAVLSVLLLLLCDSGWAAKKAADPAPAPADKKKHSEVTSVIEEVTAKQLERVLNEKDFVAVFWCKC